MGKRMKRLISGDMLASIVMVIFGLVLLFAPEHTLELATKIVGIGLLIMGVILFIGWVRHRSEGLELVKALVVLAGGAVLLINPLQVVSLVPLAVGVLIVLNGIVNFSQAMSLKKISLTRWQMPLVLSLLTVAVGAVVILNPLKTIEWMVMGIGAALIFNGVTNLWIGARYRKLW